MHELLQWLRTPTTPPRIIKRTAVVLLSLAGWRDVRIAQELSVTRRTVALWRQRFAAGGAHALLVDAPGRGRKPGRNKEIVAAILARTQTAPPAGRRWTVRSLAHEIGVSHATVQRVWREHQIRPGVTPAGV